MGPKDRSRKPRAAYLLRSARNLPYLPFLAQLVVIRRCNLKCGYCNEYDTSSDPVPYEVLAARMARIRELGALSIDLTGGEPLLHPEIERLVAEAKRLGFFVRGMITNAYLLTQARVRALGAAGLTDMQISIDGVEPNEVTVKVLRPLRARLDMLAREARFRVILSAVIGAAPPAEVRQVVAYAKERGLRRRVLLMHDGRGALALGPEDTKLFEDLQKSLGRGGREARDYRNRMIRGEPAPFKCRAGSRYIYVDENGLVRWCSQTAKEFSLDIFKYTREDLKRQFYTYKPCNPTCTLGCARTNSKLDEWRAQPLGRKPSVPA